MLQKTFYAVAIIAIALVIIVTGFYSYNEYLKQKQDSVEDAKKTEKVIIPTIQQRLNEWNENKHMDKLYELCLSLPEETVHAILGRIGTTASYEEIGEEYLRNKEYYISLQIKDKLPAIVGPDRQNVEQIEIKTKMKPAPKEEEYVPAMVKDSLQPISKK